MSRRPSLPGAAELFRATTLDTTAADTESVGGDLSGGRPPAPTRIAAAPAARTLRSARRVPARGQPGPSGRERHEEKITVYCSADELVELESARLQLRAEHGLAVDRGRIVREAVAVVLADLEAKGESSILVRRLREP
jgi:hypothetical protein